MLFHSYSSAFNKISRKVLLGSLGILLSSSSFAATYVLVNDDFSDGNITGNISNGTMNWYGATSGDLSYVSGQLQIANSTTSARSAMAHFMPQGQQVTLGIGDTMTLSFDFSPSGTVGAGAGNLMRFGIFSTDGIPASYIASHKSTAGLEYYGYLTAVHNSITALYTTPNVRADIMVRDQTKTTVNGSTQLITNSTGMYNPVTTAQANYNVPTAPGHDPSAAGNPYSIDTSANVSFVSGKKYSAELTLTRISETEMLIQSKVFSDEWGLTTIMDEYIHTSGVDGRGTFSFDTIAFSYFTDQANSYGGFQTMLIDNIRLVSSVPEPSRVLLVGCALGAIFLRRRPRI